LDISEAAAILPGLEAVVNAIGDARLGHFPRIDPRVQFPSSTVSVYAQVEASEIMAAHMLTARNELKWIQDSREVLLNSFQLAGAAFSFRLVEREKLVPEEVLAKVPTLAEKLEKYRKRTKRAAIKELGGDAYGEQAECWRRFVQYLRCIMCFRPTFRRSTGPRLIHRDRREKLLTLAKEVAPTLDPARLRYLVDLAKREVLRGRHPETLGLLVEDDMRGREFLARFISKHDGPYVLASEFQSLDVQQSERGERMKAGLVLGAD
jgi:hypothetical protein